MSKRIVIECLSCPETPVDGHVGQGYHDKLVVSTNGDRLWHGPCSACPNAWKPGTGKWWDKAYGWAGPGEYPWECVEHRKFGKCLLLNNAQAIFARNRNPNHQGKHILKGVFLHAGGTGRNKDWRGSGGCPTICSTIWPDFIKLFDVGEKGTIAFVDFNKQLPLYV